MNKRVSLRNLIKKLSRTVFDWGTHDCCQWVATHISQVLGVPSYAVNFVYSDEDGARTCIQEAGGIEAITTKAVGHGPDEGPFDVGDVCMVTLPVVGDALGIRSFAGVIVLAAHGMITIPEARIKRGWKL